MSKPVVAALLAATMILPALAALAIPERLRPTGVMVLGLVITLMSWRAEARAQRAR